MAQLKHTIFFLLVTIVAIIIVLAFLTEGDTEAGVNANIFAHGEFEGVPLDETGRPVPIKQDPLGTLDIDAAKQMMLDRVQQGVPLSTSEKENFLSVLSGRQFAFYNFTDAEADMIINALNQ